MLSLMMGHVSTIPSVISSDDGKTSERTREKRMHGASSFAVSLTRPTTCAARIDHSVQKLRRTSSAGPRFTGADSPVSML